MNTILDHFAITKILVLEGLLCFEDYQDSRGKKSIKDQILVLLPYIVTIAVVLSVLICQTPRPR